MTMLIRPDGTPLRSEPLIVPPQTKPLDHERGEVVGGLGDDYVVVPLAKWADTPLIDMAVKAAHKVFTRKATNTTIPALRYNEETILVQEYHAQDRIAVIIAAWGRQMGMRHWGWLYHTTTFKIEGTLKSQLVASGRWKPATRH